MKKLLIVVFINLIMVCNVLANIDYYDARNDGIVTPAKDQGIHDSCWAFASVGALESHIMKKNNLTQYINLSEQQLILYNTYSYDNYSGGGPKAMHYWETHGPIYEECLSYDCSDDYDNVCEELNYRVENLHTVHEEDFKESIYTLGPMYFRFNIYPDFGKYWSRGYKDQIYICKGGESTGSHAVLIIGWDDGKTAWLCKNSRGPTTGPNGDGTFWIAYGKYHSVNPIALNSQKKIFRSD